MAKCIGCDKPSKEGLCENCEIKLSVLEKALQNAGTKLELVEVNINARNSIRKT